MSEGLRTTVDFEWAKANPNAVPIPISDNSHILKWTRPISVAERLPERGQEVLVYDHERGVWVIASRNKKGWWYDTEDERLFYEIKEWLPLPPPPGETP